MGPHHLAFYDTLARRQRDDLDAIQRRHRLRHIALTAAAVEKRSPPSFATRLRCRLARALVQMAARLDPDLRPFRRRNSPYGA